MRLFVQFGQVRGGYLHAQFPDGKVALGKRPRPGPFFVKVRQKEREREKEMSAKASYSLNQHAGELFSISKNRKREEKRYLPSVLLLLRRVVFFRHGQ